MSEKTENPLVPIQEGLSNVNRQLSILESLLIQLMHGSSSNKEPFDKLTIDQAIIFLKERAIPMEKSQLYKLTSDKKVPCTKFGKRLIFSRQALNQWIESKLVQKLPETEIMSEHLAVMTNKKIK